MDESHQEELEVYGDSGLISRDVPVPRWLKLTYITLPIWGVISFALFWNGSWGWFDRGYWQQLQRAANTTFPHINEDDPNIKAIKMYMYTQQLPEVENFEQPLKTKENK